LDLLSSFFVVLAVLVVGEGLAVGVVAAGVAEPVPPPVEPPLDPLVEGATLTLVGLVLMFGAGEDIVLMVGHEPIHCADAFSSKKKDGAKMSATSITSSDRLFIVSTHNTRVNQVKIALYTYQTNFS